MYIFSVLQIALVFNYLCNAISNAFPCKFMPYFRRYKFFVISIGYMYMYMSVYWSAVRKSCWYKSI